MEGKSSGRKGYKRGEMKGEGGERRRKGERGRVEEGRRKRR